jgi:long-chain fatty acid transport protein
LTPAHLLQTIMKRLSHYARLSGVIAGSTWASLATHAAGIALYEIATPDLGLASAGYAARAQDASTVFSNPAGMSLLEGSQFLGGAQVLFGSLEFSTDSDTSRVLGGGDGGNALGPIPAASLFLTHPLSEKFTVGFGMFSYFGLAEEYDEGWVGRYYAQKNVLLGMTLMPAVSYQATDWLSIGAGLNAMYGYLDTEVAIRTGAPGDGRMEIGDETWGFGANVGVLMELSEETRVGVTYLSSVNLDFEDRPAFSNLGPLGNSLLTNPPQLDLGMTVPQSVMLSGYHELNPRWALLANVGWQNWHEFGKVDVGVDSADPQSLTKSLGYDDTWHGAIGAQYQATDSWLLSGGFAYDTSAVNDENRTAALPMGEAYRVGVGAQWRLKECLQLGFAYEFMWMGDMPVTQDSAYRGRLSGGFEDSWINFFNCSLAWIF